MSSMLLLSCLILSNSTSSLLRFINDNFTCLGVNAIPNPYLQFSFSLIAIAFLPPVDSNDLTSSTIPIFFNSEILVDTVVILISNSLEISNFVISSFSSNNLIIFFLFVSLILL